VPQNRPPVPGLLGKRSLVRRMTDRGAGHWSELLNAWDGPQAVLRSRDGEKALCSISDLFLKISKTG
jgi:hypothetical protein